MGRTYMICFIRRLHRGGVTEKDKSRHSHLLTPAQTENFDAAACKRWLRPTDRNLAVPGVAGNNCHRNPGRRRTVGGERLEHHDREDARSSSQELVAGPTIGRVPEFLEREENDNPTGSELELESVSLKEMHKEQYVEEEAYIGGDRPPI
jgi:hypothetical protein